MKRFSKCSSIWKKPNEAGAWEASARVLRAEAKKPGRREVLLDLTGYVTEFGFCYNYSVP